MSTRPANVTGTDWMRSVERRLLAVERRSAITTELLGPGISAYATEVSNWNDDALMYNGFFFSAPGAINGPDTEHYWMGTSMADPQGRGIQRLTVYRDIAAEGTTDLFPSWPGVTFVRAFYNEEGASLSWTDWMPEHPVWFVTADTNLTLTTTTNTVVSGLTQDIMVQSLAEVYAVTASVNWTHNDAVNVSTLAWLEVDGVQTGAYIQWGSATLSGAVSTVGTRWVVSGLTDASHNFQIKARLSGTGSYTLTASNSTMCIERLV